MMWTDYSVRYIKHNKMTSIFLAGISFLAAALLSLMCGVFYNLWADRVYRKTLLEGSYTETFEPIVIAYIFILIIACAALTAMIHNAFEVSMSSRLHQLGILQSVGATPKQMRVFLLQEAFVLSLVPVIAGVIAGTGLCYGFMRLVISITDPYRGYEILFRYHFGIIAAAFVLSMATVLISAWIPARRICRMNPLLAIHFGGEPPMNKMKRFQIFSSVFGISGELARKALYSRKKALRTSTLSLGLSFLAFTSFLTMESISGMSTQHTYFERYRDKWDIMLTTSGMQEKESTLLEKIRGMKGVESCTGYKKIQAGASVSADRLSGELKELEMEDLTDRIKKNKSGTYDFQVPIYVLDDISFQIYCRENKVNAESQAVAVNRIWDSIHSDNADKTYIPLLDTKRSLKLKIESQGSSKKAFITVEAFIDKMPEIKEEFEQYSLSLVLPQSSYAAIADRFSYSESSYNIKTKKAAAVKKEIEKLFPEDGKYTLKTRQEEEQADVSIRKGLRIVVGLLAGLLSCIGLTNVFSFTLGQIYQRRKEFARYLSVGLSPKGMREILIMEALIIGLRPLALSLVINIPVAAVMLNAAGIPAKEFVVKAPVGPIVILAGFILLFVGIAYYFGGRKICRSNIADILKDETMI